MLKRVKITDEEIIKSIKHSDKNENKSIQFILNANRGKIGAYVLKNNGSSDDVDIVLTEGVTQLIFNLRKDKFRNESSLSTYLYAICTRMWSKSLMKENRYVDFESNYKESVDEESSPLNIYNESELKSEVVSLLGQIGEGCKLVLELWSQHYSMQEIASRMGYKNAQISMNKKNKCLTKLKGVVHENCSVKSRLKSFLES